ncbi:biopolymer transporter ExbD [Lysobacter fragariae]
MSAYASDSRSGRAMAEMNITPLVDVMLVLLIIFMVAAPMMTRTMEMRLPQAPRDSSPPIKPVKMTLSVQADGTYALDGATLTAAALQASLASVARDAPNTIVEIAANADADYQSFSGALAAARNSGITNIALQR